MTLAVFNSDIPSDSWLEEKLRWTHEDGRNQWGVPKTFGPVTGSFDRLLNLPVALLASVPGERAEQSNVRQESLEYIRENFELVRQEPVYVEIDPYGKAWINEGNHRIMVAVERGELYWPTMVRYFSGAERKVFESASEFAPYRLIAQDSKVAAEFLDRNVQVVPVDLDLTPDVIEFDRTFAPIQTG